MTSAGLSGNPRNARKHSPQQVALLCENIRKFTFTQPILIDEESNILAGHISEFVAILERAAAHD